MRKLIITEAQTPNVILYKDVGARSIVAGFDSQSWVWLVTCCNGNYYLQKLGTREVKVLATDFGVALRSAHALVEELYYFDSIGDFGAWLQSIGGSL